MRLDDNDKANKANNGNGHMMKVLVSFLILSSITLFLSSSKELQRELVSVSSASKSVRAVGLRSGVRDDEPSDRSLTTSVVAESNSTVAYLTEQVEYAKAVYKVLSERLTQRTQERDELGTKLDDNMQSKEELIAQLKQQVDQLARENKELVEAHTKTEPPADLVASLKEKEDIIAKLQLQLQEMEKTPNSEMTIATTKEDPAVEATKEDLSAVSTKVDDSAVDITLDTNATIWKDIASIHHLPEKSQVIVNLHASARCPRPYLMGRLSGPALVMLDWTWSGDNKSSTDSSAATTMTGNYDAPLAGEYFLEIMVIHCDNFLHGLDRAFEDADAFNSQKLQGTEDQNPITFDFKGVCTEEPLKGRITAKDASILVPVDQITKEPVVEGFWRKADKVEEVVPAFTRFQAVQCFEDFKAKRDPSPICLEQPGLEQFLNYEFEWSPSFKELSAPMLQQPSPTTICYAGFSHTRRLIQAAPGAGLRDPQLNLNFVWLKTRYPGDLTGQVDIIKETNCSSVVIGVYQWPGSYDRKRPHTMGQFYQEVKEMIHSVQKELPDVKLFFRSVHTNSLMGSTVSCPAKDWRTPTVMSGYNDVIQQVCRDTKTPFLDASFLTTPVWDAAPDYNHLDERTSNVEILYLTASALGIIVDGKLKANPVTQ